MPVTVKVNDEANLFLEAFLGYKRAQGATGPDGKRLAKEHVVSESIKNYVTSNMPASLVRSLIPIK